MNPVMEVLIRVLAHITMRILFATKIVPQAIHLICQSTEMVRTQHFCPIPVGLLGWGLHPVCEVVGRAVRPLEHTVAVLGPMLEPD